MVVFITLTLACIVPTAPPYALPLPEVEAEELVMVVSTMRRLLSKLKTAPPRT